MQLLVKPKKVLKILKTFFVKIKTKTLFFVLDAPRDQDFSLEDCITANWPVVEEVCALGVLYSHISTTNLILDTK